MSATRQLSMQAEMLHPDLADLDLVGRATQIEFDAKRHYSQLVEDLGEDVAMNDHNRRASRYSKAFDGKYRSVIYFHASKMGGQTHQHFWGWKRAAEEHNRLSPEHELTEQQFRKISYELATIGVLEIKNRKREDTVAPDALLPLNPTAVAINADSWSLAGSSSASSASMTGG